jgi:hypothetical protein
MCYRKLKLKCKHVCAVLCYAILKKNLCAKENKNCCLALLQQIF